jgi:TonB-linked SusC/RagA family outer membrane protein
MLGHLAVGQTRVVTGKVTDNQNQPLIGASVVVKGTTAGTYTDVDGNFTLAAPADATNLTVRYLGMKAQDILIGAGSNLVIVMQPDIAGLDEVVVTAIAIQREKRSLGYSTQQVGDEDLTSGRSTDPLSALQGKVSGVNITSLTGGPGTSNRIVIRGGTSLTRSNQALIVVDGVPVSNQNFRTLTADGTQADDLNNQVDYGNRANDINPDDIESITVLKGPAAAALYGSRASNGALIITTKKGKRMIGANAKNSITYNTNFTFSSVLKLPEFQNTYGQGDLNGIPDDRRENFSWGYAFDSQLRPWGQEIDGKQRVKPYEAIPDNVKNFFDIGTAWRNNISLSGGNDKNTYYLSLGSLRSIGIVPTTTFDRYNVLFNASSQLSSRINTSISINYTNSTGKLPTGGQQAPSVYYNLLQTPRDVPITEGEDLNDPFNAYDDATHTYGFYGAYALNPYFVLANFRNDNNVDRVFGNATVTYTPLKWLSITNRLGMDVFADRRYQRWKSFDYAPIDLSLYSEINNRQTYQGRYSEDIYNWNSINNDLMVTLQHKFTEDISATLLLGHNIRQDILHNAYAQTNDQGGLALPGYYNLNNSNGPVLARSTTDSVRNMGYYGDLSLAYRNLLFVDITGRRDRSSTILINGGAYFYPSASVSFVFSELFTGNLKENIWTYGKLRASYAKVGNDAPAYVTTNTFGVTNIDGGFGSTQFPFNGVPGYTQGDRVANADIKPEFTTATEVGLEMSFLKDRLSLDASLYWNKSTDQIINIPISEASGFTSQVVNAGEVQNNGIELLVRATPVLTQSGFRWDVFGTYTKNNNEVVSLMEGVDQIALGGSSRVGVFAQVGQPYGAFYGVDLLTDPNGNVVVDPASGQPITTTNPVYLGSYQPDFLASWGTDLSYKGITLHVLFNTRQGGVFYSNTKSIMDFVGASLETEDREPRVWEGSVYDVGDGTYATNTTEFSPYDYYTGGFQPDAQHIIDASYTKLREASIGYTLPTKWLTKTPFGSASVSLFGNNLVIWTPDENQYADPEVNSSGASNVQGFEFNANPSQRNYGIDLRVTF